MQQSITLLEHFDVEAVQSNTCGTIRDCSDPPALAEHATLLFQIVLSWVVLMQDGGWSNFHRPPARARSATSVVARLPAGVQVDLLSSCGLTCLLLLVG